MIYKKKSTTRQSNQTHPYSKVKITRIGRLFKPPGHELKHIIWNISVTKSLPALKSKTKTKQNKQNQSKLPFKSKLQKKRKLLYEQEDKVLLTFALEVLDCTTQCQSTWTDMHLYFTSLQHFNHSMLNGQSG